MRWLVMALAIGAFTCGNRDGQCILGRRDGATVVRAIGAIRIVRQVEVKRRRMRAVRVVMEFDLKITSGSIGLAP